MYFQPEQQSETPSHKKEKERKKKKNHCGSGEKIGWRGTGKRQGDGCSGSGMRSGWPCTGSMELEEGNPGHAVALESGGSAGHPETVGDPNSYGGGLGESELLT